MFVSIIMTGLATTVLANQPFDRPDPINASVTFISHLQQPIPAKAIYTGSALPYISSASIKPMGRTQFIAKVSYLPISSFMKITLRVKNSGDITGCVVTVGVDSIKVVPMGFSPHFVCRHVAGTDQVVIADQ